jgi:hypothetical protein
MVGFLALLHVNAQLTDFYNEETQLTLETSAAGFCSIYLQQFSGCGIC